jgi:thioesterase domain-containing protein
MFMSNAVDHHFKTRGNDSVFVHEIVAMQWLTDQIIDQWVDVELEDTPVLYVSSKGLDFPRWGIELTTNPCQQWGPLLRDMTIVPTEVDHYQLVTDGAAECARHIQAWLRSRGLTGAR